MQKSQIHNVHESWHVKFMAFINVRYLLSIFPLLLCSLSRPLRRKIPRPGRIFLALHPWPSLTSQVGMVEMGMFKRKPVRFNKKHPALRVQENVQR